MNPSSFDAGAMPSVLTVGPRSFVPALAIFDKDGTLIDFHAMWGRWIVELARRLEAATGRPVSDLLFRAMGFELGSGRVRAEGPLAVAPMANLRSLAVEVLAAAGLSPSMAQAAVDIAWHTPDPVALARPLADLPALFGALREHGVKIAIATTDDHDPTEATLASLGAAPFVDALICGDDGVPSKPAPDMVLALCRSLNLRPSQAMVVGDTIADMRMGRTAGAGLLVGVLSGVSSEAVLVPHADVLLPSIAELAVR
jgi:phosphoglycolate phosphatase-like HAD superfamily hydrolase